MHDLTYHRQNHYENSQDREDPYYDGDHQMQQVKRERPRLCQHRHLQHWPHRAGQTGKKHRNKSHIYYLYPQSQLPCYNMFLRLYRLITAGPFLSDFVF